MTTASAMVSLKLPTPPQQFSVSTKQQQQLLSPVSTSFYYKKSQFSRLTLFATSPTSSTSIVQEEQVAQDQEQAPDDSYFDSLPPGACKGCGNLEMERNCNGDGRIQGGIATVPGFGWWPIKAYRPCPGFVASGGRYRRQGQSMDEVAGLGRERKAPKVNAREAQSSKKDVDSKKVKR